MEAPSTPRYSRSRKRQKLNGDPRGVAQRKVYKQLSDDEKAKINRSAVSNSIANGGRRLFVEQPESTKWRRRWTDLYTSISNDLGGNHKDLSEAQRQLVRRVATMCVESEKMEHLSILGEPFPIELYCSMASRLAYLFQKLGIKRQPHLINSEPASLCRQPPAQKSVRR